MKGLGNGKEQEKEHEKEKEQETEHGEEKESCFYKMMRRSACQTVINHPNVYE